MQSSPDARLGILESSLVVSARARSYAARELLRRTGMPEDVLRAHRVEVTQRETLVHRPGGARPLVSFPHGSEHDVPSVRSGVVRTMRAAWPWPDARNERDPADLIVPYVPRDTPDGLPLFRVDGDTLRCTVDLLAATLFTLGRLEELLPGPRDAWGRFPARGATLWKAGCLDRPVVDEWGLALGKGLSALVPARALKPGVARFFLSHDIDEIGVPFRARTTLGHVARRRSLAAALQDVLAGATGASPALLAAVRTLVQVSRRRGMAASVYLKASERSPFDSGYSVEHPKLLETVRWLRQLGVELGVHPGHETHGDPARLGVEVDRLRRVLGADALGGRQHHLRWSPGSWLDWESVGLAYDASVGFADEIGFRAGTCVPYRPWLLWLDREASLVEVPLVVMDTTLLRYKRLGGAQIRRSVAFMAERCRRVGGVFSLLWHNTNVLDSRLLGLFGEILDDLAGWVSFDARAEARRLA